MGTILNVNERMISKYVMEVYIFINYINSAYVAIISTFVRGMYNLIGKIPLVKRNLQKQGRTMEMVHGDYDQAAGEIDSSFSQKIFIAYLFFKAILIGNVVQLIFNMNILYLNDRPYDFFIFALIMMPVVLFAENYLTKKYNPRNSLIKKFRKSAKSTKIWILVRGGGLFFLSFLLLVITLVLLENVE